MGNLKILPEHIQLLNGLVPHLGKKDATLADRTLSVLKLLSGQPEGRRESMLNLMAAALPKSNDDMLQALGTLIKNNNIRSQKDNSSDFNSSFFVFLFLFLLLQDFK